MNKLQIRNSFLLLLTAIIWGSAFVAQSAGMNYIGPFTFGCIRYLIGSIVLLPVIKIFSKKQSKSENMYNLKAGICCGICLFLASATQQIAMMNTSAGKAGFITALYIVIVPIISIFLKKKCSPLVWISVVLSVIGLYLLCIGIGGSFIFELSDLLLLLCALLFSFHILTVDHFTQNADGVKLSSIQFFVVGILNLPFMLTLDGPLFHMSPSIHTILLAWLPILYAGIFSSGIAYTLQVIAQKGLNPTVASLIMSLESVTAAITGVIILHEYLSLSETLGCVIMFIAIILAQLPTPKKSSNN